MLKSINNLLNNIDNTIKIVNIQNLLMTNIITDLVYVSELIIYLSNESDFSVRQTYKKSILKILNNIDNNIELTNNSHNNNLFTLAKNIDDDIDGITIKFNIKLLEYDFNNNTYYNKYTIGITNLGNLINKNT